MPRATPEPPAAPAARPPIGAPLLCLVTDRLRHGGPAARDPERLLDLVQAAAAAGIDLVQIREPDLDDRMLGRLVARAVEAARGSRTAILVNDRPDVALAHGAAGVHLKGNSLPAVLVRAHVPPGWIMGRSIHGVEEGARVAAAGGLDYVLLGTVFPTPSKPGRPPLGVAALRQAVEALPVPVLAIGGLSLDRVPAVAAAGAAGFAASGLFAVRGAGAPERLRRLVEETRAAWRRGPGDRAETKKLDLLPKPELH